MAIMKLHEFEELFQTLTKQLHHISQSIAQLIIEIDMAYNTIDQLKDKSIPSTFVDEIIN